MEKISFTLCAFVLLFSSVVPTFASTNEIINDTTEDVETDEEVALDNLFTVENTPKLIAQYNQLVLNAGGLGSSEIRTNAGFTQAIKAAIRAAIKNKTKLFDFFERLAGKRYRTALEKRFDKYVVPELNKILEYDTLIWETVQDATTRSLINAGMKETTARSISLFLTNAIKWFL